MTITKKHLKELADIFYKAQKQAQRHKQESLLAKLDFEEVADNIKSFAKKHGDGFVSFMANTCENRQGKFGYF